MLIYTVISKTLRIKVYIASSGYLLSPRWITYAIHNPYCMYYFIKTTLILKWLNIYSMHDDTKCPKANNVVNTTYYVPQIPSGADIRV